MNDEEIRKAARDVYDATPCAPHSSKHGDAIEAVFRAGMEAGRAEASKRAVRSSGAEPAADMAAFMRRLENDPEEAARLLGAKPKRRKGTKTDAVGVDEIVQAGAERQHAEDWMCVRKQHKAPLTRTSWEAMGREAAKAGFTIGQAVQMCAERGWRGFRAEYVSGGNQHARPAESFQSQAALARVQRIAPGAARKDAGAGLKSWQEAIEGTIDAGQPRLR